MMNLIESYKTRFYNLLESTMGDVKPLLVETTTSGSPLFQETVKRLGFEVELTDEDLYKIKNLNQITGVNFGSSFLKDQQGNNEIVLFLGKFNSSGDRYNSQNITPFCTIYNLQNLKKIEDLKNIINKVVNGLDENYVYQNTLNITETFKTFYQFYKNNNLEGYTSKIDQIGFQIENDGSEKIYNYNIVFTATDPNNRVKFIQIFEDELYVSYDGRTSFKKDFTLTGNKISFEKDRKATKGTQAYKRTPEDSLWELLENNKYIKYGTTGNIVKQIQSALLKSGALKKNYPLAKDIEACKNDFNQCSGRYGANTFAAVKDFQEYNDLVVDGIVGPDTAEALYKIPF